MFYITHQPVLPMCWCLVLQLNFLPQILFPKNHLWIFPQTSFSSTRFSQNRIVIYFYFYPYSLYINYYRELGRINTFPLKSFPSSSFTYFSLCFSDSLLLHNAATADSSSERKAKNEKVHVSCLRFLLLPYTAPTHNQSPSVVILSTFRLVSLFGSVSFFLSLSSVAHVLLR